MNDVAARRGLGLAINVTSQHAACRSDQHLLSVLRDVARDEGVATLEMVSGAAHDAQQMAKIAPMAMIFVRSHEGRSHTPEEFSTLDDIVSGVRLLAAALHRLAY
jgi:allantoate deiminase